MAITTMSPSLRRVLVSDLDACAAPVARAELMQDVIREIYAHAKRDDPDGRERTELASIVRDVDNHAYRLQREAVGMPPLDSR